MAIFLTAELTGGYQLFLPLLIVSTISYGTIKIFEPYSIYTMRLANADSCSPTTRTRPCSGF